MKKNIKEKIMVATGSVSGAAGILGSWQVCHNLCLTVIALLAIFGITLIGMPLIFLTKLAVPFWITAAVLLVVTIGIYVKKKCISKNLIMFNSGLIVAGIPFRPLQDYSLFFWIIGGTLAGVSICLMVRNKLGGRTYGHNS